MNRGQHDLFLIAFFPLRQVDGTSHRPSGCIHHCRLDHRSLGRHRPDIQVQRHVAIGHKYRHDDRDILMVFLIQNTQNRESHAVQLKLDELIRAVSGAHNALLDLEGLEEADLSSFE
jgi:low affinity iron permease